jgi:hypothetical protein
MRMFLYRLVEGAKEIDPFRRRITLPCGLRCCSIIEIYAHFGEARSSLINIYWYWYPAATPYPMRFMYGVWIDAATGLQYIR